MSLAMVATAAPMFGLTTTAASAAGDPNQVNFTLEGCRNDGSIVLPNGSGDFICPDSAYTTGNLGKGWNELDLVPFRVTADAGNSAPATQTYAMAVVVDREDATRPGYDVLSAPVLNTALSSVACTAATVGAETIQAPGLGGISKSLYRILTITQPKNTTCVYDYYARLALGSHLFPGSSLHANLANQSLGTAGIGSKEVSIPVKEILPQEISKDMTATQGNDHVWSITKDATPATLSFENTCDTALPKAAGVLVTVRWTKLPATPSGPITVLTHVYAKNPAARVITINVSDAIRSGTSVLETVSSGAIDVPANTANFLVLTHQTTVPAGTTDLNDVASATYTDKVTQVAVPGTTTATAAATVQSSGIASNATATISDVESITGDGLSFSVDDVDGASGTFGGGYTLGTRGTAPVSWTSAAQSDSGSVTFDKTVYVDQARITTGTLADIASLVGSDGFAAQANASTAISSGAVVSLDLTKTIPNVLTGAETASFTFQVFSAGDPATPVDSHTFTFTAGQTSQSHSFTGLAPGTYVVHEVPALGWAPRNDVQITINLPTCSGGTTVANGFAPATARVQKVSNPAGSESGWVFDLVRDGNVVGTATTNGTGFIAFNGEGAGLVQGTYTVTEHAQAGWDQTAASPECSFTVNYPDNADHVFSCTITNTRRGSIIVRKATNPVAAAGSFTFSGDAAGSIGDGGNITVTNLVPGTYTSTEADPTPGFDLTGIVCDDSASATPSTVSVGTRTATFKLDPGETITCTFTNTKRGRVEVLKTSSGQLPPAGAFTFEIRQGATPSAAGTVLATDTNDAAGLVDFGGLQLVPGDYQVCETAMLPAWANNLTGFTPAGAVPEGGDNSTECVNFTLDPGEVQQFAVDNTPPPGGDARTIGFWRNWTSCDGNGNQAAVLDQTLASFPIAGGQSTHGVWMGKVYVDTCGEAVQLLNKSTIDNDKKMASDAAYGMAAQLLAAKLNRQAGAGVNQCSNIDTIIAQGQALLDAINFNGTGSYLPSNSKGAKLTQRNAALDLARKLDQYNNNLSCA